MNGMGREGAPFSGRVWQEIDQSVGTAKAANCTARRFLTIDGPYGLGLTSVGGDEGWPPPYDHGADHERWNVSRPDARAAGAGVARVDPGTYLVSGTSRPVPLIASEFVLGMRAVEAFESGCQPLDVCSALRAARDVALEEERLIYYGIDDRNATDQALLKIVPIPDPGNPNRVNATYVDRNRVFSSVHGAFLELAARGYAGPFALAVEPTIYSLLYTPATETASGPLAVPILLVDLLRNMFRGGVFMVPAITPDRDQDYERVGAIVTVGRPYSRLVVGQDWVTTYRGSDGVLYRYLIVSSLQLRICDHRSIQVLSVNTTYQNNSAGQRYASISQAVSAAPTAERRGRR